MPNEKELDFELVDDTEEVEIEQEEETKEDTTASDEESKTDSEEDTTSSKKSNWKRMSKVNKWLKSENASLKQRIAELEKGQGKQEDIDDEEDIDDGNSYDELDLRLFLIENSEAKDHKKGIIEALDKYPNMSFDDALDFAKAKTPKQSHSSTDFSSKGTMVKTKKKLSQLTEEEALKLDGATYLKWARSKWMKV